MTKYSVSIGITDIGRALDACKEMGLHVQSSPRIDILPGRAFPVAHVLATESAMENAKACGLVLRCTPLNKEVGQVK